MSKKVTRKLTKEVCKYCEQRIEDNKIAFINGTTYCSPCFNKIRKWGPDNGKHMK